MLIASRLAGGCFGLEQLPKPGEYPAMRRYCEVLYDLSYDRHMLLSRPMKLSHKVAWPVIHIASCKRIVLRQTTAATILTIEENHT
jgi:hypothetical protein